MKNAGTLGSNITSGEMVVEDVVPLHALDSDKLGEVPDRVLQLV